MGSWSGTAALLVEIGDVLRGSIEVGNGDVVMVALDAHAR
jgi:hypothetical protein